MKKNQLLDALKDAVTSVEKNNETELRGGFTTTDPDDPDEPLFPPIEIPESGMNIGCIKNGLCVNNVTCFNNEDCYSNGPCHNNSKCTGNTHCLVGMSNNTTNSSLIDTGIF